MATHSGILAWRIPMERGAWWDAVQGVAKSWTRLSDKAQLHSVWLNYYFHLKTAKTICFCCSVESYKKLSPFSSALLVSLAGAL